MLYGAYNLIKIVIDNNITDWWLKTHIKQYVDNILLSICEGFCLASRRSDESSQLTVEFKV